MIAGAANIVIWDTWNVKGWGIVHSGTQDDKFMYWTDHTVGSGSGSVSVTSMGSLSLSPGDRILIAPGTYSSGITITNLNQVAILNNAGTVNTTSWTLGNDSAITIAGTGQPGTTYGFVLSSGFTMNNGSHIVQTRIWNCKFTGGTAFNVSGNALVYDLTNPWTKAVRNCSFVNWYLTGASTCMQGSFGSITAMKSVIDSVDFVNTIIDNNQGGGQMWTGAGFYRILIDGGRMTGDAPNAFGDAGMVQIEGNCVLRRFFRSGGYGYLIRICTASLDGIAVDSYVYLCIDVNHKRYGTIDVRSTNEFGGGQYTGVNNLVGGKMYFLNNTSFFNQDTAAAPYTSVQMIVGNMVPDGSFIGHNNVSGHTYRIQADPAFQINTADALDTANNRYFADGRFFKDTTLTWMPLVNSGLISGGTNESAVFTTDFNKVAWGGTYGIGAVKYVAAIPPGSYPGYINRPGYKKVFASTKTHQYEKDFPLSVAFLLPCGWSANRRRNRERNA